MKLRLILCFVFFALFLFRSSSQAQDYLFSPDQGAVIDNNRPLIRFSFPDGGVDASSVRMVVNGSDVTDASMKTPMGIMYTPANPLSTGKNRVEVLYRGKDGSIKQVIWDFTVQPEQLIQSVEHDADVELLEDEVFTVTVKGKPDCRGTFDVDDLRKNLPLKEVSPGVYKGIYRVVNSDKMEQGYVVAHLQENDGTVYNKQSSKPLDIDARFFKARIYTPKNLEKVSQTFTVRGRTAPNVTVYMSSQLGMSSGVSGPLGAPATRQLTADRRGFFAYRYFFPITMRGLKATITVHSVDAKGNKSLPDQIVVYVEGEEKKPDGADNSSADNPAADNGQPK